MVKIGPPSREAPADFECLRVKGGGFGNFNIAPTGRGLSPGGCRGPKGIRVADSRFGLRFYYREEIEGCEAILKD